MFKRITSLLLAMVMVFSMLPVGAFAEDISASESTEETVAESIPEVTAEAAEAGDEIPGETQISEEATEEAPVVEEPALAASNVKNETYLQELHDKIYANLDCEVVVENDFVWTEGSRFSMTANATLTVSGGATFTLDHNSDIRGKILVESGAALVVNDPCTILPKGVVRVEKGGRLQIHGSYINCYDQSVLDVRGTFESTANASGSYGSVDRMFRNGMWAEVNGVPASNIRPTCMVSTEAELREVLTLQDSQIFRSFLVSIGESMSIREDLTFVDHTITGNGVVKVDGDATVTIEEEVVLTLDGTFSINEGILLNNGEIVSNGWLSINDRCINNATVKVNGGRLSVASGAVFENNGIVSYGSGSKMDINGTWDGAEPVLMVLNEEYLRQLLNGADRWPMVEADVVLENDFVITGNINVLNVNATITVPAGKTLTIQDITTFVNHNGAIVVEKGGKLILNSSLSCWGASRIEIYGTIETASGWGRVIANYEGREFVTQTVGVPYNMLWLRFMIDNDADLQNAVQVMKKTDYVYYVLLVHGDIDLSADLTIPDNAELLLSDSPSTMTIPAGKTVINNGTISVNSNQIIHNLGTIENNQTFSVYGKIINEGTFRDKGQLYMNGVWEGNPAQILHMTQSELEAAMKKGNGSYYLSREVKLERELKVKGWLEIGTGGKLIVPKGKKLTVEADSGLSVSPYGVLEVYGSYELKKNADGWKNGISLNTENGQVGTVIGVKEADLQPSGYVYNAANFPGILKMLAEYPNADNIYIYAYTVLELPGDTTLPENCIFHMYNGATLRIPEGCTLTNNGDFYCWEGNILRNSGTIDNHDVLLIAGSLHNEGHMNLQPGSVLVVQEPGYVNNTGSADAYTQDTTVLLGTWEGNPVNRHYITQDEFEQMIADAAAADGVVTLNTMLTLERDLVIPETVGLNISGGTLQVPDMVTLVLNCQGVDVFKGGIHVLEGGKLELRTMIFVGYNGVVNVEGQFLSGGEGMDVLSFYENGLVPCTVTGVPMKHQRLHVLLRDQAQYWQAGMALFENNEYGRAFLEIMSDVTLPGDLTIPENGMLLIEGVAEKLVVPEGVTLTNRGIIRIDETKRLQNEGAVALMEGSFLQVYGTWDGNWPEMNGGNIYPCAESLTIEGSENMLVDLRRGDSFTLQVTMPGAVFPCVKWTSSNTNVVDVSAITDLGGGTYQIAVKGTGKTVLTAATMDGSDLRDSVNVEVEWADWSPRFSAETITVNPMLTDGARVALVPSYSNAILSCRMEDTRFTTSFDAENALLIVNTAGDMKNATVSTKLIVSCVDGSVYTYPVKIIVKSAVPAITVKQSGKLDLFYTDSQAVLDVTAKDAVVTDVQLTDTEDFCLENGILRLSDTFVKDYLEYPALKPDAKAAVTVYLEGYRYPVVKTITIGTTTSKISLITVPSSGIVHSELSADLAAEFCIANKSTKEPLALEHGHIQTLEASFVDQWNVENGAVTVHLAGKSGGTVTLWVRMDNWMNAVKVTYKITVNSKLPTVKATVSTLQLSNIFPKQTAKTELLLSHGNLAVAYFENGNVFASAAKAGSAAWEEADKLEVIYDGTGIVARIKDPSRIPKAGTYAFTGVPVVGITRLKALTVKVNVSATLPKIKLGSSTIKLNSLLSGGETGGVKVTMTNVTGYHLQLVGFEGMDAYRNQVELSYKNGAVHARLLTKRTADYSYNLIPVVADDQGTQIKLAAVKLKVQSYEKAVSVTQTGKGNLDAIDRSNKIVYTIGKISNALGTVEKVELAKGAEHFALSPLETDAKGKQVFALSLREDADVSVKTAYEVQFRYTICGREVLSKPIKLKIKESALKVSAPAVTWYHAQQMPLSVRLAVTAPENARIADVSISSKTSKELLDAIGAVEVSTGTDVRLAMEIRSSGNLVAGKSYKLVLDITPVGHADDAKVTTVTVTVKIAK